MFIPTVCSEKLVVCPQCRLLQKQVRFLEKISKITIVNAHASEDKISKRHLYQSNSNSEAAFRQDPYRGTSRTLLIAIEKRCIGLQRHGDHLFPHLSTTTDCWRKRCLVRGRTLRPVKSPIALIQLFQLQRQLSPKSKYSFPSTEKSIYFRRAH
jgi:hypothetical protein